MPDDAAFAALVAHVGAFHITDRSMRQAQSQAENALRDGTLDAPSRNAYLRAVRRYFDGFRNEARAHLRDVDKRLEEVNQVHFNLTAERGVAVKRIEATEAVLRELETLQGAAS
jgi:hypothetical protein